MVKRLVRTTKQLSFKKDGGHFKETTPINYDYLFLLYK